MAHVPRIHHPAPLRIGDQVPLPSPRAHHLTRVLKRAAGDSLVLFQAPDQEFDAVIREANRRDVTVEIIATRTVRRESTLQLRLIQGVARGDRMDFSIQKAVELGVTAIQPVLTQRGGVQMDASRREKKQQHWQAVALSAAEQSGRCAVPTVADCAPLERLLQHGPLNGFVLAPGAAGLPAAPPAMPLSLLVGPEGGLTDAEIAAASAAGLTPLGLGPRILRTETAGIVALSILQQTWGDLNGSA